MIDTDKYEEWLKVNCLTVEDLVETHYTHEGLMAWLSEHHPEVHHEWLGDD
tara:strand:+ start:8714 stop:8866 length:153 start_codon:yes stop_codon:yes gene_type:complete